MSEVYSRLHTVVAYCERACKYATRYLPESAPMLHPVCGDLHGVNSPTPNSDDAYCREIATVFVALEFDQGEYIRLLGHDQRWCLSFTVAGDSVINYHA